MAFERLDVDFEERLDFFEPEALDFVELFTALGALTSVGSAGIVLTFFCIATFVATGELTLAVPGLIGFIAEGLPREIGCC